MGINMVSRLHSNNIEKQTSQPQFNPLATKAINISLSGFGTGSFFGFDHFSEKWKNQKKSKSLKKETSSQGANSSHEALGNEWLETGNCSIAKSYGAVSGVLPLVAKALQPPPGMKFKCPPAVVAARAALARTSLVKTVCPQFLPMKMMVIEALGMSANIPLGIWIEHTKKFSPSWFIAVHTVVPFIAMLRMSVVIPKTTMAVTIASSILGQVIGSRAERIRLKRLAGENREQMTSSASNQLQVVGVQSRHCGEMVELDPLLLKISGHSGDDVCY